MLWWPTASNECHFGYHCRWWASDCCNLQRGGRNKLISRSLYNFMLNPSMAASCNPFQRASRGWGMYGNHGARGENGSSWWGCLCDVCFASKQSSEREFFIPARTHLGVKLLRVYVGPVLRPESSLGLKSRDPPILSLAIGVCYMSPF